MFGFKRSEFIEIIGIAAVVISLLFVAYEIRENTNLASAQALLELSQLSQSGVEQLLGENDLLQPLITWEEEGLEALTPLEYRQLQIHIQAMWNVYEAAYQFWEKGILNEEDAAPWFESMCYDFSHPADSHFIQEGLIILHPDLVKLAEESCGDESYYQKLQLQGQSADKSASTTVFDGPGLSEPRELVEAYLFDFWRDRNEEVIHSLVNSDTLYVYNDNREAGNAEVHIEALHGFGSAFSNLVPEITTSLYSSDNAGVATRWTGTHSGELCGSPATGKSVSWSVNFVFHFKDGRISEIWEAWDEAALFNELGIDLSDC